MKYEVRQIDAWNAPEGWTWNESWRVGAFETKARDEKRAFTRFLKRRGIVFSKSRTRIEYDGDIYEIVDRKTREPLFAALPC